MSKTYMKTGDKFLAQKPYENSMSQTVPRNIKPRKIKPLTQKRAWVDPTTTDEDRDGEEL